MSGTRSLVSRGRLWRRNGRRGPRRRGRGGTARCNHRGRGLRRRGAWRRGMRADGRQNGTARKRRPDRSGEGHGWSFRLDHRRFLAFDLDFSGRRRPRLDMRGRLDNRRGFWLSVLLDRRRRFFARSGDMLRLGGFLFHFRDSGGSGGMATLRCRGRPIGRVPAIMTAKLDGRVFVDGAGVRLLFGDAKLGEQVQYFVGLHFQLPRQLVNSDLSHR